MGIFSQSSTFDPVVEKATLETNTKEDWALILDICDKVTTSPAAPKDCLRSIVKRLNHQDPHVVLQAITLLDACVSNCGIAFHLEIASREFEQEYRKLIQKHHEKTIRDKLLHCLQKWAENEFKNKPQLDLIPSLYGKLKMNGTDFPDSESPSKSKRSHGQHHHHHHHKSKESSGPNATQQEAEDLAKAIELSLRDAQQPSQSKSLYHNLLDNSSSSGTSDVKKEKEPRKVRALYDFEAAEDNELTFYSGEIVHVLDDTNENWWQGSNQRGSGLFPSNFVTADLSAEPQKINSSQSSKKVQFSDEVEVNTVSSESEPVEIDEKKIDDCLNMLHEADPTGELPDPVDLSSLEEHVHQMGPLIDQELEKIDRRHVQLSRLGIELVEALNMYHNLMREPVMPPAATTSISMPLQLPYPNSMGMPIHSIPNLNYSQSNPSIPPPNLSFPQPNTSIPQPPQQIPPPNYSYYDPSNPNIQ